jgi:phosphonate transport system substrate-binding protein
MDPFRKSLLSLLWCAALAIPLALQGCNRAEEPAKVSLKVSESPPATIPVPPQNKKLRVAIAAMISPKETFVSYKELMDYIGEKLGMDVELVQREKYEEVNELLRKDLLDVAFVCTGAYVDGHDDFGMEILVAPVTQGRTVYYSYIIVPKDSPAKSLEDLRGKTFAFTDPMSNTGKLAPTYKLALMNETPAHFFKSTTFTYSHDKSIEGVARKVVDGASVDSLIWDYLNWKNPEFTSKTKIISKSDPYGIPPIVVSKAVSPELKANIKDLFLRAHKDPKGKEILSKIMIEKFVAVDDGIYDSVRNMQSWVDKNVPK